MEENTQKGILIGCLSSTGIMLLCIMLTFAMIAFCIRGCAKVAGSADMSKAMEKAAKIILQDIDGQ